MPKYDVIVVGSGVLNFSAKTDLRAGLLLAGLADKTTATAGDRLRIPLAIAVVSGNNR